MNSITLKITTKDISNYVNLVSKMTKLSDSFIEDIRAFAVKVSFSSTKELQSLYKALLTIEIDNIQVTSYKKEIQLDLDYDSYHNSINLVSGANTNGYSDNSTMYLSNNSEIKAISDDNKVTILCSTRVEDKYLSLGELKDSNIFFTFDTLVHSLVISTFPDTLNLNRVIEESAKELYHLLATYRLEGGFTYKKFIYDHLELITDYSILRKALKEFIGNGKRLEKAITTCRKVLDELPYEYYDNVNKIDGLRKSIQMNML